MQVSQEVVTTVIFISKIQHLENFDWYFLSHTVGKMPPPKYSASEQSLPSSNTTFFLKNI